jgi:hypothetical protein
VRALKIDFGLDLAGFRFVVATTFMAETYQAPGFRQFQTQK